MACLRTGVFLLLMLLPCTEASLAHPVICYILDGFLLVYCILATALFVRQKFLQPVSEPTDDPTYSSLQPGANTDDYEELNTDPKSGATRKRRQEASNDTYQSLQKTDEGSDTYQVIEKKGRARRGKKEKKTQVHQTAPGKKEMPDSLGQRPPAPRLPKPPAPN